LPTRTHEVNAEHGRSSSPRTTMPTASARRRPESKSGLAASVLSALLVGSVVAVSVPLEHRVVAQFQLPVAATADLDLPAELWRVTSAAGGAESASSFRAEIDHPDPGRLTLHITSTDRRGALGFAHRVAREFEAQLARRADELRSAPSPGEQLLIDETDRMRAEIRDAEAKAEAAMSSLPPSDPRVNRQALLSRWQLLRTDWSATRATLERIRAEAEQMRSRPEPASGIVSAEERRAGIESDAVLQQDLRELNVRLSELRLHLLAVWQKSAGRLDQLRQAADVFAQTLGNTDTSKLPANITAAIAKLTDETETFRALLASFIEAWTAEFTALQRAEVDPFSGDVLEVNERVRKILHDFLFASGQRLATARGQIKSIAEDPGAGARHHVLHSTLTRGFQAVQAARHRFEFAAGSLETPENFRLDASLRAARGIRRRTHERIEQIEKKLLADATQRARRQQQQALIDAEQAVEKMRSTAQQTVEELLAVQEAILDAGNLTDAFVAGLLRAELAAQRVQALRQDLAVVESRLRELETDRRAAADAVGVELLSCDVIGYEFHQWRRARVGLVGLVVTFLVVLVSRRMVKTA